jgi:choline dehydrogenase
VHGLRGLRVADASVLPTLPSSNTNAPAIAVGLKAADMIAEDARAAVH